jgi:hypothetical protein
MDRRERVERMRKNEKGEKDEVSVHWVYVEINEGGRMRGR